MQFCPGRARYAMSGPGVHKIRVIGPMRSGFEGIEDNTDRIQSREEFAAAKSSGVTLADALAQAGVDQVDVVGIAESHCVKETALDAAKLGYQVTVFEDMTVPVSEDQGVEARKAMAQAGIRLLSSNGD